MPLAIQALTGETLSQLNVSTVEEFVKFLPSVTTATLGPGQSNIYMRGLSVGTLGTQGSGTNGPWPNVAVYLDEQSTQVPGRNLDVYAADFERIEVLDRPAGHAVRRRRPGRRAALHHEQAAAQRVRRRTSRPAIATTAHGDESYNVEGMLNVPLIDDKLALRVVVYHDNRGGYIDNVSSTFTRRGTDLGFAQSHGRCRSGRFGRDRQRATSPTRTSTRSSTTAPAASLKWQITDDWDALLAVAYQKIEGEGVFYQSRTVRIRLRRRSPDCPIDQKLKPLEVTLFNTGSTEDEFVNTALTVNGKVGPLDLVYAGAYLTRDAESISGLHELRARRVGHVLPVHRLLRRQSVDKCYSPSSFWDDRNDNTNMSHEIRLSSPTDWRMRFVGGLFYEDRNGRGQTDWHYKSLPECPDSGVSTGDCFLYLDPRAAPKFQSAVPDMNNPNRRASDIGFFNDFQRDYTQSAAFASVDFDILENLTLTLGTRYYDIKNSMRRREHGQLLSARCTAPATRARATARLGYGYGDCR